MVKIEFIIEKLREKLEILSLLKDNFDELSPYPCNYRKTVQNVVDIIKNVESDKEASSFNISVLNTRGKLTVISGVQCNPTRSSNYAAQLQVAISLTECKIEEYEMFNPLKSINKESFETPKLFLSKSFDEGDVEFNTFIERILNTLEIPFTTGEKYSPDSIPKKIEDRIDNSDLLLVLAVKRDKKEDDSYTIPPWISREMFYAKGKEKDYIVLQEEGTEDIPGLLGEKEILFFERNSITSMQDLYIELLEAFKQHHLV